MEEQIVKVTFFNPLFSCFITLCSLTLIYLPNGLIRILLSPVLLISGALLLSLLRLGSTRESNTRPEKSSVIHEEAEVSKVLSVSISDTNPDLMCDFLDWNLKAPLEVIHEYDEEEEEEEEENPGEKDPTRLMEIGRYPSLSLCYPESDSESDSASSSEFNFPEMGDWNSLDNRGFFRWEEEKEDDGIGGEGLIEIKLSDEYNQSHNSKMSKWNQTELDYGEEDGLIEIDLFQ